MSANICKKYSRFKFKKQELWNLDNTISTFIYQALIQFKNSKRYGYPQGFKSIKDWDRVLDKMIYSFKALSEFDDEEKFIIQNGEYKWVELDTGKLIEEFTDLKCDKRYKLHVVKKEIKDRKIYTHRKKKKEGFDLFVKHYNNLWD